MYKKNQTKHWKTKDRIFTYCTSYKCTESRVETPVASHESNVQYMCGGEMELSLEDRLMDKYTDV
jgi:hypothetical protein